VAPKGSKRKSNQPVLRDLAPARAQTGNESHRHGHLDAGLYYA
jgi:hypothetical protein